MSELLVMLPFNFLKRKIKHKITSTCNLVQLSISLFGPFLWILYGIQSLVGICYKKIGKKM